METERLILDRFTEADREDYFISVPHDKKVLETFMCPYAETSRDFDMERYISNESVFAIRLKETGRVIGLILSFDETEDSCEVGYAISSRMWGRGYATEALTRFIGYCFGERGMKTVRAGFFTGNEASRRVMEKSGMRFERFVEKELTYLGAERDVTYYSIAKAPRFRNYREEDYDDVCDFLVKLNETGGEHINWNWARFEWMYEHPEFDKSLMGSIGLWFDGDGIVGAAIYDMYFGEAFCAALPGHESLYGEILDYARENMSDGDGLAVSICDLSAREIAEAEARGFVREDRCETVMEAPIAGEARSLPEGLEYAEPDPVEDQEALQWLFWQGFDHGSDRAEFEREEQPANRVRRHFNKHLGLAARDASGELVSIACLWYMPGVDYAYVEPVCTVPAYRGKGVAGTLLTEAMRRAGELGAKRAIVISDIGFYRGLGFKETRRFTFYRKPAE